MSLIQSIWNLLVDTVGAVLALVWVLLANIWDLLLVLHMEAPRLEGLLIGVTLAWLMMRRGTLPTATRAAQGASPTMAHDAWLMMHG